ncbi:MAG: hypothetical protein KDH15_08300 [Rhodocyclaceae bacterium]|nr:hypothetical protein [Rhodocyclaceae bacterium]
MKHKLAAVAALLASSVAVPGAEAAGIAFSGPLQIVEFDNGGGRYSGVPLGTLFSGMIDDTSFAGSISDGRTTTVFDCCIAAGGFELTNDLVLDADQAALFNQLAGAGRFAAGEVVDLVDIEGDTGAGGGRIEVGLSFVFSPTTFAGPSDTALFDPGKASAAAFFVFEEDASGLAVYSGIGPISAVPGPDSAWLMSIGMAVVAAGVVRRRRPATAIPAGR